MEINLQKIPKGTNHHILITHKSHKTYALLYAFFIVNYMKDIFENVNIDENRSFLRETKLYRKI